MAGTAVFQTNTLATPGAGIVVHTDNVQGTVVQIIKVDVGPAGTTVPLSYASGTGLPVQGVGTFQALGSFQAVGTTQTKDVRTATSAVSTVAASATNVTLLASNANRLGAAIFNDSSAVLYTRLGATASTSLYTLQIGPLGYYEVPFNYTGQIDGLWSSATGTARITEFS